MTRNLIALLATLAIATPLCAQEENSTEQDAQAEEEASQGSVRAAADILRAILLPRTSEELREEGVPEEEVEAAIWSARQQGVPAAETQEVLEESRDAVRDNGPIDNFGAFVQTQLDAGLRGRDLAAAIHAEHARRGIGKGKKLESKRGRSSGRARPDREVEDEQQSSSLLNQPAEAEEQEAEAGKERKGKPEESEKGKSDAQNERGQGRKAKPDTVPTGGGL